MNVNYEDARFKQVEEEKQNELNKYNDTYDKLIEERNNLTQQQQGLVDQWQQTQEDLANQNLQHQLDLYNQQKEKSEKDFQREASASYSDYLKEVDKYGVSRENVVANGLSNSGYAESSKVDMYNTYQNRLASARRSLNDAVLEFDNAIKEAQLSNNATLAQNALEALQRKLDIAMEDFNYKDTQTQNKLTWENNINNQYYGRYKDVESQLNYENEQKEAIRQFNEQMERQKEQDRIAQQRWEKEMELQKQQFEYQKKQDAIANSQKWSSINTSNSSNSSGTKLIDSSSNSASQVVMHKNKSVPMGIGSWAESQFFNSNVIKNGITVGELESKLASGLENGNITKKQAERVLSWFGL